MALTPEQAKYFDDLGEMFGTQGWRKFIEELTSEIYNCQVEALEANNWETVCKLRGKAEAYAYITKLEDIMDFQKDQLELASEGDDELPSI